MTNQQIYKKFAKYYDKIYAEKDYESEIKFVKWVINKHKISTGNKLLDVACGTGNNTILLKDDFKTTGVDISPEMLKLAKKKLPGVKFIKGDMKTLALKERFDVIVCMFASIAYNLNYDELESTLKIFYKHLQPGGASAQTADHQQSGHQRAPGNGLPVPPVWRFEATRSGIARCGLPSIVRTGRCR